VTDLPARIVSAVRRRLAITDARALASSVAELAAGVDGPIVLLVDGTTAAVVPPWLKAFGPDRVHVLAASGPLVPGVRWLSVDGRRAIEDHLALVGTCAVIVDEVAADPVKQFERWARFGPAVRRGGWYVLRAGPVPLAWQAEVEESGYDLDRGLRQEFDACVPGARKVAGHFLLPKQRRHVLRVGEKTAATVLPVRSPDLRVATIAERPATAQVGKRLVVVSHGSDQPIIPPSPFEAPALVCRWYRGEVEIRSRLLTLHADTVLPPSFRHAWAGRLRSPELKSIGRQFSEVRATPPTLRLEGDYFDLNAGVSGHFGHVVTESLGKLWAWDEARSQVPGLKGFYRLPKGATGATFEAPLFEAFGIPADQIYWATSDVTVDSYVSATMPWHNAVPFHFHPAVEGVWRRLRAAMVIPDQVTPERIFVSRGDGDRQCRNQVEVEAWFARRGFAVVYPERLPLRDQATLFAGARVVAGFAGSALFSLLYSTHVEKVILLTHTQYSARNEWLYAVSAAAELHYFWSEPETKARQGVRWADSFHSAWAFDIARFERELEATVT
jgi:capsular polysaccharide biosynthesis protein